MIEKYEELNNDAREYILSVLKYNNKRINKEIELLYNNGLLFIIEILYRYKLFNKNVKYRFNGSINNLTLLYHLGLIDINPIKLSYKKFNDKKIDVELLNMVHFDLLLYIEDNIKMIRLFKCFFKNTINDNYYIIIPIYVIPDDMTFRINDFAQLETVDDCHKYEDDYVIIKLGEYYLKSN